MSREGSFSVTQSPESGRCEEAGRVDEMRE